MADNWKPLASDDNWTPLRDIALPATDNKWGNRVSAAVDSYQSGMYGLAEAATGAEWAKKGRKENDFLAKRESELAKQAGGVDSYKDVHGISDAADYVGGLAVQSFPYLAENAAFLAGDVMTGGALVPAHAARVAAMAPRFLGGAALKAGASMAERRAALEAGQQTARSVIGAVAPSYASSAADILGNQRDQLEANGQDASGTDLGAALMGAVPYSLLNAVSPGHRLAAGMSPKRLIGALDGVGSTTARGVGLGAARFGMNAGVAGAEEGANEMGQEFINQRFGRMAVDPNQAFYDDSVDAQGRPTKFNSADRFKESFVGGMAMGGTLGGAAGGWRRSEAHGERMQAEKDAQTAQDLADGKPADLLQLGHDSSVRSPSEIISFPDGSAMTRAEYAATFGDKTSGNQAGPSSVVNMQQQDALKAAVASGELSPEQAKSMGYVEAISQPFQDAARPGAQLGTQDVIGQTTGAGLAPYVPRTKQGRADYVKQFDAAAGAQTGQQIADASNGQVENNDTDLEAVQRRAGILEEERARAKAIQAAAEKHAAARQAATTDLIDANPDGSLPVKLNPRETATHGVLATLRAAGTITEEQQTDFLGRMKDALKNNDKKALAAVASEVKALSEPKPVEATNAKNTTADTAAKAPAPAAAPVTPTPPVAPATGTATSAPAASQPKPVAGNAGASPVAKPRSRVVAAGTQAKLAGETVAPAPVVEAPAVVAPVADTPGSGNTVFTDEERARRKAARAAAQGVTKLHSGGIDSETLADLAFEVGYHVERGARSLAKITSEMLAEFGDKIKPHVKAALAKALAAHRVSKKEKRVEVAMDREGMPLVATTNNASGEATKLTVKVAGKADNYGIVKKDADGWSLHAISQFEGKGASRSRVEHALDAPISLGEDTATAMDEMPYALAKGYKQLEDRVAASKAAAEETAQAEAKADGRTLPKKPRAVPFKSGIEGDVLDPAGEVDFDKLLVAAGHNPKILRAVRYYLGVDDDGSFSMGEMSQTEAARMAGLGENSQAAVSAALKALGISKGAIDKFKFGEADAPALPGFETEEVVVPLDYETAIREARTRETQHAEHAEVQAAFNEDEAASASSTGSRTLTDEYDKNAEGAGTELDEDAGTQEWHTGMNTASSAGGSIGKIDSDEKGFIADKVWYLTPMKTAQGDIQRVPTDKLADMVANAVKFSHPANVPIINHLLIEADRRDKADPAGFRAALNKAQKNASKSKAQRRTEAADAITSESSENDRNERAARSETESDSGGQDAAIDTIGTGNDGDTPVTLTVNGKSLTLSSPKTTLKTLQAKIERHKSLLNCLLG